MRGRGHIGHMQFSVLRRSFALFAALALLVGLHMAAMPAAASLAPGSIEIASQSNPMGCKNCVQAMTGGDCVAVCNATPILSEQMVPGHIPAAGPEILLAETMSTASVEPDLTPPRI